MKALTGWLTYKATVYLERIVKIRKECFCFYVKSCLKPTVREETSVVNEHVEPLCLEIHKALR